MKLGQGNCGTVRDRGKAAYVKDASPRTGTWYKAGGRRELAQRSEALGSLIHQLKGRIADKRVLRLVGKYLRAGVRLPDGRTEKTLLGMPQGGPLSSLLANIMLDPLDKRIEAMGRPFARYADDFLIVTRTKAEALAAMAGVKDHLEGELKLLVNPDKSKVAPLGQCDFLGFNVKGSRIRRRVRLCHWKDWKRPKTRRKRLLALGISREEVHMATRSRKGYWRMASNRLVQQALDNTYLKGLGLPQGNRISSDHALLELSA